MILFWFISLILATDLNVCGPKNIIFFTFWGLFESVWVLLLLWADAPPYTYKLVLGFFFFKEDFIPISKSEKSIFCVFSPNCMQLLIAISINHQASYRVLSVSLISFSAIEHISPFFQGHTHSIWQAKVWYIILFMHQQENWWSAYLFSWLRSRLIIRLSF